jgi:hypothetical protein
VTSEITEEAERLRRQAERALRLARAISDEQAAHALRAHAAKLFEKAESLEPTTRPGLHSESPRPAQHQQQIQPNREDESK